MNNKSNYFRYFQLVNIFFVLW